MSFSATEAAFEGFRVVRRHPMTALIWGLAYLVLYVATFGLGAGQWAAIMASAQTLEQSSNPSPEEMMALGRAYMGLLIWLAPLGLVIGAVLSAAVARSVLRPAENALGYLRLGMDEVRVLGVTLAITVILGLLGGVLLTIVLTVFGLGIASGQAVMYLIALILGLGAAALVIWLSVKLCLAVPMTIDRGKFTLFESFKATNGQFWPLLGMTIIALVWSVVNALMSALQLAVLYAPFSAAWQGLRDR